MGLNRPDGVDGSDVVSFLPATSLLLALGQLSHLLPHGVHAGGCHLHSIPRTLLGRSRRARVGRRAVTLPPGLRGAHDTRVHAEKSKHVGARWVWKRGGSGHGREQRKRTHGMGAGP